jgi:hypothetical protein
MSLYTRFKDRFGSAGVVLGVIALILALGGTAIAAGGLTKQQEKQVVKISKKYAGKPGATGATGAPGATGPAGAPGAKGDAGLRGAPGEPGEDGEDGEDGACSAQNPICEIPPSATLTGVWGFSSEGDKLGYAQISFPLQLTQEPLEIERVPANEPAGSNPNCPGTSGAPKAEAGYVCIYYAQRVNIQKINNIIPDDNFRSGLLLEFEVENTVTRGFAHGTWAVTPRETEA